MNTARQAGSALGIAILGTILSHSRAGADPMTFRGLYDTGMRDVVITAGLAVLAGALLLALQRMKRSANPHPRRPARAEQSQLR
ncbi:hypothetical protein [Nonomuraea rubra]|uniref:Uncharacterized protein n=1 Tax=Nonomuraea rubra TaxID=46180 RepID=A0A7X0P109_9ACTN|nr:hypothetical protein [Nonomuraea rubra]MBB6553301.1 hypothetical protein [Nonomuraea rubra]